MDSLDSIGFLTVFLSFLTLVNPIQKVFLIFALRDKYSVEELRKITDKATITALGVLVVFLFLGVQILGKVFNIEIYAFQVTSGAVLIFNGLLGLQKGAFIAVDKRQSFQEIVAVPIAIPMIAGPATITAAVTMPHMYGMWQSLAAIVLALAINWAVMRNAGRIGSYLTRENLLSPLIRIIGLIVASIGTQMMLNGIRAFIQTF